MGFVIRLLRSVWDIIPPKAGGTTKNREYRQDEMALLNVMMAEWEGGLSEVKISSKGHPICPHCHFEHPISAKAILEHSDGRNVLQCPKCMQWFQLDRRYLC